MVVILYLRLIPSISSVIVDYSLEQGKVQKELLHELEIPYAILDTQGHVMWANNIFHDIIGVDHDKRIKKTVDSYFPELTVDLVSEVESIDVGIEYEDRRYRVTLKKMDLSSVFEEDKLEKKDDDIVIAMYLFDETELRRYEQETVDQKLYAGLIYLDNYDEVMDYRER